MVKMPLGTSDLLVDEMLVDDDSLIAVEPDSLLAELAAEFKDTVSSEFIDGINDTIIASTQLDTVEQVLGGITNEGTTVARINVFPNPFQNNVNVVITNPSSQFELNLYNSLGQLVFSQLHRSSNIEYRLEIDLSPLAAGTYYLSMENENYRKVVPIIKSDP